MNNNIYQCLKKLEGLSPPFKRHYNTCIISLNDFWRFISGRQIILRNLVHIQTRVWEGYIVLQPYYFTQIEQIAVEDKIYYKCSTIYTQFDRINAERPKYNYLVLVFLRNKIKPKTKQKKVIHETINLPIFDIGSA